MWFSPASCLTAKFDQELGLLFWPNTKVCQVLFLESNYRHHYYKLSIVLYNSFQMPQKPKAQLKTLPYNQSETIGERIAKIRKRRGLTQAALATKIGIASYLVSDYERGRIRLYDEMVLHFAVALGCSCDEILRDTPTQSNELPNISLRFLKRIAIIEAFPEATKKHILRTLDDTIEANKDKL